MKTKLSSAHPVTPIPPGSVLSAVPQIEAEKNACYWPLRPDGSKVKGSQKVVANRIETIAKISRSNVLDKDRPDKDLDYELDRITSHEIVEANGFEGGKVGSQSHLHSNLQSDVSKPELETKSRRKGDIQVSYNLNMKTKGSPGLRSLRSKNRAVRDKIENIEKNKVERKKVSLSPNKVKIKELSERIKSKVVKYDKNAVNGNKDGKMIDKMELRKSGLKKLKLIGSTLNINVKIKDKLGLSWAKLSSAGVKIRLVSIG